MKAVEMPWAVQLIACLPREGVVIDIEAGAGLWARSLAARVDAGRVYAFAASPSAFGRLVESCADCRNVEATPLATDVEAAGVDGFQGIGGEPETGTGVSPQRLDAWLAAAGLPRLDLVKVELPGREEELLRAARPLIERFRPVVQFSSDWDWASEGASREGARPASLFSDLRYRVLRLDTDGAWHSDRAAARAWTDEYLALPGGGE